MGQDSNLLGHLDATTRSRHWSRTPDIGRARDKGLVVDERHVADSLSHLLLNLVARAVHACSSRDHHAVQSRSAQRLFVDLTVFLTKWPRASSASLNSPVVCS